MESNDLPDNINQRPITCYHIWSFFGCFIRRVFLNRFFLACNMNLKGHGTWYIAISRLFSAV